MRRLIVLAGIALAWGAAVLMVAGQTTPQKSATIESKAVQIKPIDFSSKHNVLIRNFDGTLSPMDEPWFQSKLIAPGTWQLISDGDFMYLVEGDNEAILIDSGYGAGNIREYAQSLTRKPLRYVANTHWHFDHTANDSYFDRAYMSAGTHEKATIPSGTFEGIKFPKNYPVEIIGDGYKLQLGNRELEAFIISNHTEGGTAYLDRKARILYSGDEIMGKQGVTINVSVAQFEKNMERLAAHRSEYDTLCAGWEMLEAAWVDKYLAIAQYILAGHEGEPVAVALPAPPPNGMVDNATSTDASGRIIYTRHIPRGGGGGAAPDENRRRVTYGGATVTFDVRHIKE